jgi:hypothetical protein
MSGNTLWAIVFFVSMVALAACVVVFSGCHLFEAPRVDESTYFWCGDVKCRVGLEECSSGAPLRCIPAWTGAGRDGGAP